MTESSLCHTRIHLLNVSTCWGLAKFMAARSLDYMTILESNHQPQTATKQLHWNSPLMTTVMSSETMLPEPSVAKTVTVALPIGRETPSGGSEVTVTSPELSDAVYPMRTKVPVGSPASVEYVYELWEKDRDGGWRSERKKKFKLWTAAPNCCLPSSLTTEEVSTQRQSIRLCLTSEKWTKVRTPGSHYSYQESLFELDLLNMMVSQCLPGDLSVPGMFF